MSTNPKNTALRIINPKITMTVLESDSELSIITSRFAHRCGRFSCNGA